MTNKYKILSIESWQSEYIDAIVASSFDLCRKSLDGKYVLCKIPETIKEDSDVPSQWVTLYEANKPYMNHSEVTLVLQGSNWIFNDIEG